VYIQELYAFFAPPFSAIFILGILSRRINAPGAIAAVVVGFPLGIAMKIYAECAVVPEWLLWIKPFAMQGIINWAACTVVCVGVSLITAPPHPSQVTDQLAFNWRRLNIFGEMGTRWYNHVIFWWGLFAAGTVALALVFSGIWL
jgi:SSS family solute:Na+ symporter